MEKTIVKKNQYVVYMRETERSYWPAHPQNLRRGEKWIELECTRAEMLEKVRELREAGETILDVVTSLGYKVDYAEAMM